MRLGIGKELKIPLFVPQNQIDPVVLQRYIEQVCDCDNPEALSAEVRAFCDSRNRVFQTITSGVYSESVCLAHFVQATRL